MKSGYVREAVVTHWLEERMGQIKPLGEAPSPRPRKRSMDVHDNLSIALLRRKTQRMALHQGERVWL